MKIAYTKTKFSQGSLRLIAQANAILSEYQSRGIRITLRGLHYQFVSRFPHEYLNTTRSYKRLGSIMNNARLAGLIDWDHLQDSTRNLNVQSHWGSPVDVVRAAASAYHRDLWQGQAKYVEVWVEKDALIPVIENTCERWDVPFFACRGYTSQSEMWVAGQRVRGAIAEGRHVRIIHLGDHDPSGVDMSRDVSDRLDMFASYHMVRDAAKRYPQRGGESVDVWVERLRDKTDEFGSIEVERIALNMDQIRQYNPPPNPAKITDSRAAGYIDEHGSQSWELDALDPDVLTALIEASIVEHLDREMFDEQVRRQETERLELKQVATRYGEVIEFLEADTE